MRYEKIILGRILCKKAPQVVPAWKEVGGTLSCKIECNEYCSLPPGALIDIALLDLLAEEKQGSQNL